MPQPSCINLHYEGLLSNSPALVGVGQGVARTSGRKPSPPIVEHPLSITLPLPRRIPVERGVLSAPRGARHRHRFVGACDSQLRVPFSGCRKGR